MPGTAINSPPALEKTGGDDCEPQRIRRLTNVAMVHAELLNHARDPLMSANKAIWRHPTSSLVLTEPFQDAIDAACIAWPRKYHMMVIS